jgi:hypothetical protein
MRHRNPHRVISSYIASSYPRNVTAGTSRHLEGVAMQEAGKTGRVSDYDKSVPPACVDGSFRHGEPAQPPIREWRLRSWPICPR